jgi:hypothetical protein
MARTPHPEAIDVAKRTLRILALLAALSALILFAVVPAALITIRSQVFIQTVIPRVQRELKTKAGIDLAIGQLKLDLIRHVIIRNTRAKLDNPQLGKLDATIGELNVRFSLWSLLKREVVVDRLLLAGVTVNAELRQGEEPPPSPPSNPIALVADLLEQPPVGVSIPKIEARDLAFHLTLHQRNGGLVKFDAGGIGSRIALALEKRRLQASVEATVAEREKPSLLKVGLTNPESGATITLSSKLSLDVKANLNLSKEDDLWALRLENQSFALGLDSLATSIAQPSQQLNVKLASMRVDESLEEPLSLNLSPLFALRTVAPEQFNEEMQRQIEPFLTSLALGLKTKKSLNTQGLTARLVNPQQNLEVALDASVNARSALSLDSGEFRFLLSQTAIALDNLSLLLQPKGKPELRLALNHFAVTPGLTFAAPLAFLLHPPAAPTPEDLVAAIKQLELTAPLELSGLKQPPFEVDELKLSPTVTKAPQEQINLSAALSVQGVRGIPAKLTAPVSINLQAKLGMARHLHSVDTTVALGGDKLLDLKLELDDSQKRLGFSNRTEVTMLPLLRSIHPAAAIIDDVGLFHLTLGADGALDHPAPGMIAFKPEMIKQAKVGATFNISVEQIRKPTAPQKIDLQLSTLQLGGDARWAASGDVAANIKGAVTKLKVKEILRAIDLGFDANLNSNLPAKQYIASAKVAIDKRPTVELNVNANDTPRLLKAKGALNAHPSPSLATLHPAAKDLAKVGPMDLAVNFDAAVHHPFPTLQQFDPKALAAPSRLLNVAARLNADVALPGIHILEPTLENAKLLTYLKVAEPYLKKIQLVLSAQTDLKTQARIENLNLETGEKHLLVGASGQSDLKGENLDLRGSLEAALPPSLPLKPKKQLLAQGRLRIPWNVRRVAGDNFQLQGEAELQQVGATLDKLSISEMTGSIAFTEELRLIGGKTVSWARLLDLSPFLRVDTSRIRPYLSKSPVLRIGTISAMGRTVGPLRARVGLNQNQLSLDDVDLALFDGVYAGQIFVDVHPQSLRLALLGRLTGLDTALLNPPKKGEKPDPNRTIAARLATIIDLNRSLAEGRVDINEIGGEQLKALIQVLDPEGKDSTLNSARTALSAAYPKYVGLQMEQGFLDLVIQLGGALPIDLKARQLPLTAILTPYTYPILTTLREVPLQ